MITIVFVLRTPGEHKEHSRAQMPVVPRVGEWVDLPDLGPHTVHDVGFYKLAGEWFAQVLVKP